jgi:hypothetical protein
MAMRILLQQKKTGLYFQDAGLWTQQAAEAMDFVSSTKAIDFCVLNKLQDVQLVLKFEQEHYEIVMPAMEDRRQLGGRYAHPA